MLAALAASVYGQNATCAGGVNLYDGSFKSSFINGTAVNLNTYAGRVMILTNVASF